MNALIPTAVLALMAAAAPAGAEGISAAADPAPLRWSVALSAGAAYATDPSFDLVSGGDAMPAGEVRVGFSPGWLSGRLELDAAYGYHGAAGTTFQRWQTSLAVQSFQLGARYGLPVWRWLGVYGRAAALADIDHLALSSTDGAWRARQTTSTFGVLGALGAEARVVRTARFALGLALEVGYAQRFGAAHFGALVSSAGGDGPAPVAFAPVDAGRVDLSGLQWRMGVIAHF